MTKAVEMDYFDIYYSHGFIGFILYFSIYIYVLYNVLKPKQKNNFIRIMKLVSLLLIIILSLFTGHIITGPAVSFIAAVIIIMIASLTEKILYRY